MEIKVNAVHYIISLTTDGFLEFRFQFNTQQLFAEN